MARGNWGNIEICFERRLCTVDGELGYFHCWEYYSTVVDASPMIGGHPGGTVSYILGIVEFPDGVKRIDPTKIKFCDEQNAILCEMAKHWKGENDEAR